MPAWGVAGSYVGRDGARDADAGLPLQEGDAPGLGVFPGLPRLHDGRLQRVGAVVWSRAQRVWLRVSLHGQFWPIIDEHH